MFSFSLAPGITIDTVVIVKGFAKQNDVLTVGMGFWSGDRLEWPIYMGDRVESILLRKISASLGMTNGVEVNN